MSRSIAPFATSFTGPSLLVASLLVATVGVASAAIHEVAQEGMGFVPDQIEIEPGDTVHWTWTLGAHTVTSGSDCDPDGLFDAPLDSGDREFSFTFNTPGTYDYFCIPHCAMGMTGTVEVATASDAPEATESGATLAFPNPFSSTTEVAFSLEASAPVRVEIFDASGRLASVLRDGWAEAGLHLVRWDGTRNDGSAAPAGIYYGRIVTGGRVEVMHLVKLD